MRYKLIIFDIDGTITRHISSWRYIHEKLGIWTRRAFRYQEDFFAGKITYRKFCELDASHWKGMPEARIRNLFKGVRYSKNAPKCIAKLRKHGFRLVAVSTGLQFMTDRVRKELKFDYAISNRLVARHGRLTGAVKINLEHGAKHTILTKIYKKFGVKPHEVISVGDSEGDIPLARNSGYSIAFNSSSAELSRIADYSCRTNDFMEVYRKIVSTSKA
ncbi:MAG: HAD family phosphatase [Candidatus Omnitrophica bacterium]|nr:HAD family phosphatase [Candidatus Omnitrophota bacterium]MCM8790239.1 HAD family phosphatase [Candidatus Omnitrophota bacterium]